MILETDWSAFVESRLKQWLTAGSERQDLREDLLILADWFCVPTLARALDHALVTLDNLSQWIEAFFPQKAVFIDPEGFVVKQTPRNESARLIQTQATVSLYLPFFLPGISEAAFWHWEELEENPQEVLNQWKLWQEEGKIQAAGAVEQVFQSGFRSGYYAVISPEVLSWQGPVQRLAVVFPEKPSFLKRAQQWLSVQKLASQPQLAEVTFEEPYSNNTEPVSFEAPDEELPMIPFTLGDLKNPQFVWPYEGDLTIRLQKTVRDGKIPNLTETQQASDPENPEAILTTVDNSASLDKEMSLLKKKRRWPWVLVGLVVLGLGFLTLLSSLGILK